MIGKLEAILPAVKAFLDSMENLQNLTPLEKVGIEILDAAVSAVEHLSGQPVLSGAPPAASATDPNKTQS